MWMKASRRRSHVPLGLFCSLVRWLWSLKIAAATSVPICFARQSQQRSYCFIDLNKNTIFKIGSSANNILQNSLEFKSRDNVKEAEFLHCTIFSQAYLIGTREFVQLEVFTNLPINRILLVAKSYKTWMFYIHILCLINLILLEHQIQRCRAQPSSYF